MCALSYDVSTAGQHAIAALWDAPLAPLAQLDRALPSEGRGQRFESSRVRHIFFNFGLFASGIEALTDFFLYS